MITNNTANLILMIWGIQEYISETYVIDGHIHGTAKIQPHTHFADHFGIQSI
jgi:hypothetical protein